MPTVLITPEAFLHQKAPYVDALKAAGFEVQYPVNPHFTRGLGTEDETIAQLKGVSAVIAGGEWLTRKVIEASPQLRVIARSGVGYDRVDIPAATERKVPVTITPTANHEAVAEQAMALLFGVAKQVVQNDARTRAGQWSSGMTAPLRGKTFGILGLGRIGRSTALRAIGMRMKVLACETYPDRDFVAKNGIELVDFDSLLSRSDILSIHCPLNDDTRGSINKSVFDRMKPGSILLNTSRGPIVKESDLIEALKSGKLSGAGLDVFEEEPAKADNPLFKLSNVVVSPHVAGIESRAMEDMGIEAADCIIKLHRGQWPTGAVVNDGLRDGWKW
jgi:D-3-phosphoglycerate dehydrogenase/(S)-sulfolactate dehydrogenase